MNLSRIGKRLAITAVCACSIAAMGAENLLPEFKEVAPGELGGWSRNRAKVSAKFEMDAENQTLALAPSGTGYADWRVFLELKPGEYTLNARFTGSMGSMGVNAYSFDKDGKPTLIMDRTVTSPVNNTAFVGKFKVPAGSVKVRLGFTAHNTGDWKIINPELLSGNADL